MTCEFSSATSLLIIHYAVLVIERLPAGRPLDREHVDVQVFCQLFHLQNNDTDDDDDDEEEEEEEEEEEGRIIMITSATAALTTVTTTSIDLLK